MSIAVDTTVLHGRFSGVENAVRGLLLGLAEVDARNEYLLYCGRDVPLADALPPSFVWRPQRFPASDKRARIVFQQCGLARAARRDGAALLHGPAYVTPMRPRTPVVASVYDLMVFVHPDLCDRPNRLHYRFVLPRCLPRCAKVIAPSTVVAESLVRHTRVSEDRIACIPLGIDSRFAPVTSAQEMDALRGDLSLPTEFLLFVGNIEPKKGLPHLVRALRLARDAHGLDLPLVVAGSRAWGADALDRLLGETGMADRVLRIGYVPVERLPCLYSLATAFVFPSVYEGFGLPPLEAMACGCPTLVSDGGALPETVGDAALVVPVGDTEALAAGLVRLVVDKELRQALRKQGLDRAKRFTWARHAARVVSLYEEIHGGD